jgi:hypothetical protein
VQRVADYRSTLLENEIYPIATSVMNRPRGRYRTMLVIPSVAR